MKLSDYIIKFLEEEGIEHIFGYIGGAITHLVDSAHKSKKMKFIQVYHEQTASIAAEGYSRNSNKIGVAMATSGPGATNMITGIADAYFDSIPTIFITGQVNTYEFKYDKPIRQQGFQETDIVSIVKPITKYCDIVDKPEKIRYFLEKAIYIVKEGRPGPVLLDIPMDIQRALIDENELEGYIIEEKNINKIEIDFEKIKDEIKNAKRPVILAGGGIMNADAARELQEFSKLNNIPVVTSLMGKGSYDEESELFAGMVGSYGNRCANMFLSNADLVLALGTRLDTRQTGTKLDSFIRTGKIIHVEIDENELEYHRLNNRIKVSCDVKEFLNGVKSSKLIEKREEWINYLKEVKDKFSQQNEVDSSDINRAPYMFLDKLNKISNKNDIFTVDIGQNQMFSAQTLKIKAGQKFLTSGGLAPMGYAIPVAIGASFSNKETRVFSIMGDGGFHIATQGLMLIPQYNLPIFVIVINNHALGMITQFQELYFDNNKFSTIEEHGYCVPNIEKMAESYSMKYIKIEESDINSSKMEKFISENRNGLIEIVISGATKVVPKLEVNNPIEDTSPKLSREELKKNMLIDII